ncbi:MAG: hypothetical protein KC496_13945 [Anaerolineae bacterium]|nr:hypothetical protein [Anaerolineae bacterium]
MRNTYTLRGVLLLAVVLLISIFTTADHATVQAQQAQDEAPDQIQLAIANMAQRYREDITVNDLTNYEWELLNFPDSSLGCPLPGQSYIQTVTPGYQFLLTYGGTIYDYRVAEDESNVVLCDTRPALPAETATPDPDEGAAVCGNQ